MREISLTGGRVAKVDDEDYVALAKYKWRAVWDPFKREYYAARYRFDENGAPVSVSMHEHISGAAAGSDVRHRNGVMLDNRRDNLLLVNWHESTVEEPQKPSDGDNISDENAQHVRKKYKGVSYNKRDNRWNAEMWANGHARYLGSFRTAREAAIAYDKEAEKLGKPTNVSLGFI